MLQGSAMDSSLPKRCTSLPTMQPGSLRYTPEADERIADITRSDRRHSDIARSDRSATQLTEALMHQMRASNSDEGASQGGGGNQATPMEAIDEIKARMSAQSVDEKKALPQQSLVSP